MNREVLRKLEFCMNYAKHLKRRELYERIIQENKESHQ